MTGPSARGRWLWPAVAAIVSVVGFVTVWRFTHAPVPGAPTIVVVPFDGEASPAEPAQVAAVSRQVATMLARLPGVQLRGTDAVQRPRTSRLTPRELARAVGATWVVTGSVGRDNAGGLTVSISLVEVETGARLCCEVATLASADDADRVAPLRTALAASLGVAASAPQAPPDSTDALVQQARAAVVDTAWREAAGLLDRALARDSNALDAWLLRLDVAVGARDDAAADRARARAQQLDALSPRVWLATARLHVMRGRADSAAAAADRAVALSGNDPAVQQAALSLTGRSPSSGSRTGR